MGAAKANLTKTDKYGRTALDVAKTNRDVYVILEAATKAYKKTVPPKKSPELIEVEAYLKKLGLEAALPQFVRGGLNSMLRIFNAEVEQIEETAPQLTRRQIRSLFIRMPEKVRLEAQKELMKQQENEA